MRKTVKAVIIILLFLLAISVGLNIYFCFFSTQSYLQSTDEIYTMESGILRNNLEMRQGGEVELQYDFDHEDYGQLIERYEIDRIAGEGSEFERAVRLMDEFAPRLYHESWYDNHIEMKAMPLLEYSLDNRSQGINCRNKAQILNEMCLALGIKPVSIFCREDGEIFLDLIKNAEPIVKTEPIPETLANRSKERQQ